MNPEKMPFEVASPDGDISMALQPRYSLKIVRPTRATRDLLVEWTAEVVLDGEGFRVAGTGREGTHAHPEGDRAQAAGHVEPARVDPERERQGVRDRQSVSAGTVSRRLLLAIDTTSEFGSIALADDDRVLEEVALHSPDGFAHVMFPEIEALLGAAQSQDHGHRRFRRRRGTRIVYRSSRGI